MLPPLQIILSAFERPHYLCSLWLSSVRTLVMDETAHEKSYVKSDEDYTQTGNEEIKNFK